MSNFITLYKMDAVFKTNDKFPTSRARNNSRDIFSFTEKWSGHTSRLYIC